MTLINTATSRLVGQSKPAPTGAEILRVARKLRGYTQAESAAHYGIEERTLRRWENREYSPRWNDVIGLVEDVYLLDILEVIGKIHDQQASDD
ncbi:MULTISPECIES: helix-turn-helix domain-containing protein [Pseudoalteromonas]|uniref:helix-turn-helix domain-containing protein n=1 Tax=Pseudoalteromonas TaxID=53246 RepID=UPI000FFEABD0|nr:MULTISPECIES: helix-turn-helix transcriptional regulator [unclassified Pseudoalteromonas]MCG9758267.1 helix-turn-helix domain-containing protein [Pseudoalteromonas sp. Isolate6]RXE85518.1 XRE family transcriptional regulator [Pseudoalteromonas sp. A757]